MHHPARAVLWTILALCCSATFGARADVAPYVRIGGWHPAPGTSVPTETVTEGLGKLVKVGGEPSRILDAHGVDVRMAAEQVELRLFPTVLFVRARFELEAGEVGHDELLVGFPERLPGVAGSRLYGFRATVDGAPAGVERRTSADEDDSEQREVWWVFAVSFPPGARRIVEVEYAQLAARHQGDGVHAGYLMRTGALWKGSIGEGTITLTTHGFSPATKIVALFRGVEGRSWSFNDLEPTASDDVWIHARPGGARDPLADVEPGYEEQLPPSWRWRDRVVRRVVPAVLGGAHEQADLVEIVDLLRAGRDHDDPSVVRDATSLLAGLVELASNGQLPETLPSRVHTLAEPLTWPSQMCERELGDLSDSGGARDGLRVDELGLWQEPAFEIMLAWRGACESRWMTRGVTALLAVTAVGATVCVATWRRKARNHREARARG